MLLVDDILTFPAHGILWIFKEIHRAAQEEAGNESDLIAQELRSLYMKLETGAITEEEFESWERILLDRLDEIEARRSRASDEESE